MSLIKGISKFFEKASKKERFRSPVKNMRRPEKDVAKHWKLN